VTAKESVHWDDMGFFGRAFLDFVFVLNGLCKARVWKNKGQSFLRNDLLYLFF